MPIQLDATQRAVVGLPPGSGAVVVGAPGSGKTETLIELAAARVAGGLPADGLLVLAGSRRGAALLRDRLAARLQAVTTGTLVRTSASVGYELARELAFARGLPAPRLLSGADQDLQLRELLEGDARRIPWPEPLDPGVRRTAAFRSELRDLMMRATEHGIEPPRMRDLGDPVWSAVADFIAEYQEVLGSSRPDLLDPAELGAVAIAAVREGVLGERLAQVRLILVDDLQQATEATLRLLDAWRARGAEVVGFGDPDIASNSFRGGEADAVSTLADRLGTQLVLSEVHRHGEGIRAVVQQATGWIGAAREGRQRRAAASGPEGAVQVIEAGSSTQEAEAIARLLRERHLLGAAPWRDLAVVVRQTGAIAPLARTLASLHVPTRTVAGGTALRDDRAALALLRVVEVAVGRDELNGRTAGELLTGPYGGLDALGLRRLRLALRTAELAAGGARGGDELLATAMADPERLAALPRQVASRAAALAEVIGRIREADAQGASAEELLWLAWDGSGVAADWQRRAQGTGLDADEANRALDGAIALFASARRFAERAPGRGARDYLDEVLDAEVPEDILLSRDPDAVLVATPAGVAGFDFDTVVVAGLQDGVWPNLRLRGTLLRAAELVAAAEGGGPPSGDERRAVLDDELRIFALAASRARERLVISARATDDEQPSALFARIAGDRPRVDLAAAPLALRPLIARLRRDVTAGPDRESAAALAALAAAGVPGASPEGWRGLAAVSTVAPVYDLSDPEVRIRVSPSKIQAIHDSPMAAFVADHAGDSGSVVAHFGTLVHYVMEKAPSADFDELWPLLEERWGELQFESPWEEQRQLRAADAAVRALAAYLRDVAAAGGEAVAAEQRIELELEPAVLTGFIDRVEVYPDGVVIVDLKTGRSVPTVAQAGEHPQLGAYQLAYETLGIDGPLKEARLVYTSSTAKASLYTTRVQPAFDDAAREAFREHVRDAGRLMTGPEYVAPAGSSPLLVPEVTSD